MSVQVSIRDGTGGAFAKVSALGQLVVAPLAYDETKFVELAEDGIAYNFYVPKAHKQFVITGIRARANRQVSTTVDAIVVVYEASSASATTVDKALHQEAVVRGEAFTLLPLNILVAEGKYVNAKTSDDDVYMTIMGYYIPGVST